MKTAFTFSGSAVHTLLHCDEILEKSSKINNLRIVSIRPLLISVRET